MKIKLLLFCILLSTTVFGQKIYKALPPLDLTNLDPLTIAVTKMTAVRPLLNVISYAFPGNVILNGAGVSLQRLMFNATSKKWKSVWTGAIMIWNVTAINDNAKYNHVAAGLMAGLFNNFLLVGVAYNGALVFVTLGIGVSLNN